MRSPELSPDDIARFADDKDVRVRRAIASRIDLDPDVLDRLLADWDPGVRRLAFSNPGLTAEQYERAAATVDAKTAQRRRRAMASEPHTARDMARSPSRRLQHAVARHSCDPEAIGSLIAAADRDILGVLFERSDLPESTLMPLAADDRPLVRAQVAALSQLPDAVWMNLARDDAPEVRVAVAANTHAAPAALTALVDRARGNLRARRPRRSLDVRRAAVIELSLAAANASTPSRSLQEIAKNKRWDLRRLVAANPTCSPRTRRMLAHDQHWPVRAAVAGCEQSEPDLLLKLSRDNFPTVQLALVGNPSAPAEAIDAILRRPCAWSIVGPVDSATDRTAQFSDPSPTRWIRGLAAGNPNASPDALRELARDMLAPPWVLGAVARNPACPTDLADELLTWLALGGAGSGSPTFDPRTCNTNPVDQAVNAHAYFQSIGAKTTPSEASRHPLWPVRHAGMAGRRVPYPVLIQLGRDPASPVRARVLSFSPLPLELLDELRIDPAPRVAAAAERAYGPVKAMHYWRRPQMHGRASRSRLNRGQRLGTLVVVIAAVLLLQSSLSSRGSGSRTLPSFDFPTFEQPTAVLQLQRDDVAVLTDIQSVRAANGSLVSIGTDENLGPHEPAVSITAGPDAPVTVVDVSLTFDETDGPVNVDSVLPEPVTIAANQTATFVSLYSQLGSGTSAYVRFDDNSSASFDYR